MYQSEKSRARTRITYVWYRSDRKIRNTQHKKTGNNEEYVMRTRGHKNAQANTACKLKYYHGTIRVKARILASPVRTRPPKPDKLMLPRLPTASSACLASLKSLLQREPTPCAYGGSFFFEKRRQADSRPAPKAVPK